MASASVLSTIAKRLEGKVALITGGASGIGECTAKLFAQHGAKVVIADIQDEPGHSIANSLGQSNSTYVRCDVSNEDHIQNAVNKTIQTYGKLDIMFNNAAVTGPMLQSITENTKAGFENVLKVNVTGVFLGMKHAARAMIPRKSGCIISTASVASSFCCGASHAYTCSKHAVLGLTRNLAVELGEFGIRVNCISPYGVATPMTKNFNGISSYEDFEKLMNSTATLKGVTLRTDDIAKAALYLASEDSKYVSGHNLVVDGGFSIHNSII